MESIFFLLLDLPFMIFFHSRECTKARGFSLISVSTLALRLVQYLTGSSCVPSVVVIVSLVIFFLLSLPVPPMVARYVSASLRFFFFFFFFSSLEMAFSCVMFFSSALLFDFSKRSPPKKGEKAKVEISILISDFTVRFEKSAFSKVTARRKKTKEEERQLSTAGSGKRTKP